MVNFTIDQLREIMDRPNNIRNMSVIAHVDHGKSTLTDSLVAAAGIIAMEDAGNVRLTDTRQDEKDRGITIKSTGISLYFKAPSDAALPAGSEGSEFLINLIDSPGHVDFSSEVTAALRVTDGALVVVDVVEGVCVQTETVLRQALAEGIVPVLTINKLDRGFLELQLPPEEMYSNFYKVIGEVNTLMDSYYNEAMGDISIDPVKGNVGFSAGLQGWAFTISRFAKMYAAKTTTDPAKLQLETQRLQKRLWGDNFHDGKKWTNQCESDKHVRGFCKFILDPIKKIFDAAMINDLATLDKLLQKLGVEIKGDERQLQTKKLLKCAMQKWLPADKALLEMTIHSLPSPIKAQKYRVTSLYTGPLDDITANSIRNCDRKGPLVMYVSKMVPTSDKGRFYAFGRVFSGTLRTGYKVRILGPNYEVGRKEDLHVNKAIQRVVIMMGRKSEAVETVPVGNTCAIVGIDQFLSKTGTICEDESTHPLISMKFSVSPVVRVAVRPKDPSDLPKLVEGLKRLSRSDGLVQCTTEESGEHIVAGAGELHLEICIKDLQHEYMGGAEIVVSEPVVPFRETVTSESSQVCLSKSANKHNRLYVMAAPLPEEMIKDIENKEYNLREEPAAGGKTVANRYSDSPAINNLSNLKVLCYGPNTDGPNTLFDVTYGNQELKEVYDSAIASLQWVTREGVLCGEYMRGVQFRILDATLHADAIHRGGGQIIPTARRAMYGAQLLASPRLMEPIFMVDIQCPELAVSGIFNVLNKRRGTILEDVARVGSPLHNVRCHLPVTESFGFTADLRAATKGQAFPQCVFDHWRTNESDPFTPGSLGFQLVEKTRKRKGLALAVPPLDQFMDKL